MISFHWIHPTEWMKHDIQCQTDWMELITLHSNTRMAYSIHISRFVGILSYFRQSIFCGYLPFWRMLAFTLIDATFIYISSSSCCEWRLWFLSFVRIYACHRVRTKAIKWWYCHIVSTSIDYVWTWIGLLMCIDCGVKNDNIYIYIYVIRSPETSCHMARHMGTMLGTLTHSHCSSRLPRIKRSMINDNK